MIIDTRPFPTRAHERLRQLENLICEEEYACDADPLRSRKMLADFRRERNKLSAQLNEFYDDPMTRSAGI